MLIIAALSYCVLVQPMDLDALTLILKGYIQLGKLKKGDKVIVPANTFIATILSVYACRIDSSFGRSLTHIRIICLPLTVKEQLLVDDDVKAIIMVHLYGQLADASEGLNKLAKEHNLLLIEDAAQAHGAVVKFQIPIARMQLRDQVH